MVELVVVIAVTAILAGFSTGMITGPIFGYMQTDNNLSVVDMADNALRRVTRQVRNALPNSVRVTTNGANSYLEFIPIKTAGRYRAGANAAGAGDALTLNSAAETTFDVIGAPVNIAANDRLVIYNLGISGADVYAGDNITNLTATGALTNLTFTAKNFALGSPNSRFYVVSTAASFACDMANRRLVYYSGYAIPANQPNTIAGLNALGTARVVIDNLTSCAIEYSAGVLQRSGVVTIRLGVTQGGAVINLMHLVNVVNSP